MNPIPIDDFMAQYRALAQVIAKPRVTHIWVSDRHGYASVSTSEQVFQVFGEEGEWHAVVRNKACAGGVSSVAHEEVCKTREEAADWASRWLSEILF